MKNPLIRKPLILALASASVALGGVSCMTTYDAYGRPVQSVDPGAAAGMLAPGGPGPGGTTADSGWVSMSDVWGEFDLEDEHPDNEDPDGEPEDPLT